MTTTGPEDEDPHEERQLSIRLPRSLCDRITDASAERCVGRDIFLRLILAEALDALIPINALTRLGRADQKEHHDPAT